MGGLHFGQMNAKGFFRNPKEAEKSKGKRSMREPFYDEYGTDDEEEFHHRSRNNQEEEDKDLKHLKLVFPTYMEGEEAMEWIKDCNEYFNIYGVNDKRKAAIAFASMHLHGVHKAWYKSHMVGRESIMWAEFSKSFVARFGEVGTENVFEQFKMLKETHGINEYCDDYEKYKGRLLDKIPQLTEEFFVGNFVGGLKEETKKIVKLLEPSTLLQAYKQSKSDETPIPKPPGPYTKPPNTPSFTTPTN